MTFHGYLFAIPIYSKLNLPQSLSVDRTHGRGIIAALNKQRMRELKMGTLGTNTKSAGLENNVILETGGGLI